MKAKIFTILFSAIALLLSFFTFTTPAQAVTYTNGACPRTAALSQNWGTPTAGDEFQYTGAPNSTKWSVYNGPGHHNQGRRLPSQIKVNAGMARITGLSNGDTGGMSAKFANQKYGKWEVCMKVGAGLAAWQTDYRDPAYHPVQILWPAAGRDTSTCREVDYSESTGDVKIFGFYNHYSCSGQKVVKKATDMRKWHAYAVKWDATGVYGYLDGVLWYSDTAPGHSPPNAMKQTVQLDWFPIGTQKPKITTMDTDYVRVYR